MRFFLHHRKSGTLETVEQPTERQAKNYGVMLNTPCVMEIRFEGMSEYQGFGGVTEHYTFVQDDAVHF